MVMRRRDFLKAVTAGVLLSGIDPFSFVSAAEFISPSQRLSQPGFDSHINPRTKTITPSQYLCFEAETASEYGGARQFQYFEL
jgi:hypothetical protein